MKYVVSFFFIFSLHFSSLSSEFFIKSTPHTSLLSFSANANYPFVYLLIYYSFVRVEKLKMVEGDGGKTNRNIRSFIFNLFVTCADKLSSGWFYYFYLLRNAFGYLHFFQLHFVWSNFSCRSLQSRMAYVQALSCRRSKLNQRRNNYFNYHSAPLFLSAI